MDLIKSSPLHLLQWRGSYLFHILPTSSALLFCLCIMLLRLSASILHLLLSPFFSVCHVDQSKILQDKVCSNLKLLDFYFIIFNFSLEPLLSR